MSTKNLKEVIKSQYLESLMQFLASKGEDVGRCGSNEFNLPCVLEDGSEEFITVKVSIPTGSRKDNTPYDGYAERDGYEFEAKVKAEKALKAAEAKMKKIARDEAMRAKKKEIAARK